MMIFIIIKPIQVDEIIATALQSNDPDDLLKATAPLDRMFEDLNDWSLNNGGRVLCRFGEFFCLTISADKVDEFSQFNKHWEYVAKTPSAVGIGGTPMEAFFAMEASEAKNGESIVLYSDDLEYGIESDIPEANLSKSDDTFDLSFPNIVMDEKDPSQEPQEGQGGQQAQGKPDEKDSVKQKVVQALMMVKQNAQIIGQLKDTNPDAYGAIQQLVEAMLQMAQQGGEPQQATTKKSMGGFDGAGGNYDPS